MASKPLLGSCPQASSLQASIPGSDNYSPGLLISSGPSCEARTALKRLTFVSAPNQQAHYSLHWIDLAGNPYTTLLSCSHRYNLVSEAFDREGSGLFSADLRRHKMATDGLRAHPIDNLAEDMDEDDRTPVDGSAEHNEPTPAPAPDGLSQDIRSFIERCVAARVQEKLADVIGAHQRSDG